MPVTRIAIGDGKSPEYKRALLDEKDGDRFMAITEHDANSFAYGPFLGIERTDDLVQIQIFRGATS
jgi:hypothetical protein